MTIFAAINGLVQYAIDNALIDEADRIYSINQLCEALKIDSFEDEPAQTTELEELLNAVLEYATKSNLCEDSVVYRDLFDTKIMG